MDARGIQSRLMMVFVHHGPQHDAALFRRKVAGIAVHGSMLVPDHHVTRPPCVIVDIAVLGCVRFKLSQQARAFVMAYTDEARGMDHAEFQIRPVGQTVTHDQRSVDRGILGPTFRGHGREIIITRGTKAEMIDRDKVLHAPLKARR